MRKEGKVLWYTLMLLKKYEEREAGVRRLTIIADEVKEERGMQPE